MVTLYHHDFNQSVFNEPQGFQGCAEHFQRSPSSHYRSDSRRSSIIDEQGEFRFARRESIPVYHQHTPLCLRLLFHKSKEDESYFSHAALWSHRNIHIIEKHDKQTDVKYLRNMKLNKIHHVAVICSDYAKSKHFYTDVLGMKIMSENYRKERDSWKADCWLDDNYIIELFSFPNPPARPSYPEAAGLRHLAFEVDDLLETIDELDSKGIVHEPIRTDEYTGKRFVFFSDPDGLPIELYEK